MSDLSRREVLGATVAAGVAGLAGCLDGLVEGETGEDGDPNDGTDEILDYSVETTDSGCNGGDGDHVDSIETGETVQVLGVMEAPNPCHVAAVNDVGLDGGELSVVLDVESEDSDTECVQCIGRIEYEATVDLASADLVETVRITHAHSENEYTLDEQRDEEGTDTGGDDEDGTGDEGGNDTDNETEDGETDEGESDDESSDTDEDGEGSGTEDEGGDSNGDDSSGTTSIVDSSIETVEAGCSRGELAFEGEIEGETVQVQGMRNTSTPCYEATLEDASVNDDTLVLQVGVESNTDGNQACIECLGQIEYEASVTFDGTPAVTEAVVIQGKDSRHVVQLGE
ncbi:hypothetical protein BRC65_02670 [Halobacteriales archaeon QH_2_65_14]|nr:MAG: hypothetical protein BRC65_02670 [Halobacteriales archaeon QH_2_65_14]